MPKSQQAELAMKKAIGYIRVSTEEQAGQGISLDAQRAKIEAYAITKDLQLLSIIEEGGKSAKNLDRPGVQKVLEMAQHKEIDAVIIVKLDRMFRNTVDALNTAQSFDRLGVALHSISESLDTKSALGKFFFTLTAALAEMERGLISERTKAALAHKKANGERIGNVPYGYMEIEGGKLAKCEQEQRILAKIRRWKKRGLSVCRITDLLNEQNIPTRHGRPWARRRVDKLVYSPFKGPAKEG